MKRKYLILENLIYVSEILELRLRKYDLQEKSLISVSEQLNIEIHIRLRKDNSRNQSKEFLCFKNASNDRSLKIGLPMVSDQREEYLLLSSEARLRVIFYELKMKFVPNWLVPHQRQDVFEYYLRESRICAN